MADLTTLIPPPPGLVAPGKPLVSAVSPDPLTLITDRVLSAEEEARRIAEERCYQITTDIPVHRCECLRCAWLWHTIMERKPKACPKCGSTYWDRVPNPVQIALREKMKKRKGSKPRRNARKEVGEAGPVEVREAVDGGVPSVPVELLGAVGGLAPSSGEDRGGVAENREEPFPVAAPIDNGVPLPPAHPGLVDPSVEPGQPVDDGGRPVPAIEELSDLPDDEFFR